MYFCESIANKDQSDLVKGGVAASRLYSPGGSIGLTVWLQFAICMFWLGVRPTKSPLVLGVREPHLTQCVIGPYNCTCRMASESVERFKQSARM